VKGILGFALTELKLILKEKSFYFWAIVLPLLFIFIFSNTGENNFAKEVKVPVFIRNLDKGKLSSELINYLKKEKLELVSNNKKSKPSRELIIPENFTDKILKKEKIILKFKVKGTKLDSSSIQVKISLYRAIYKFLIKRYLNIKKPEEVLSIKSKWAGKASYIPTGVVHQMPATILTFLLFNILIFGGTNLIKLRERGILRRFVITPFGKKGIWVGLFLTNMFVATLVSLVIIIISAFLFSVSYGIIPILNMLIILFVFSVFVSSMSIYFGSVLKRAEAVVGVSVLVANLLAGLGGCWWPIEIVPEFMKKIAMMLPTGWAMEALDKLLFYKFPFVSVMTNIIVLTLFTIFFAILSIKFFKIEKV